MAERASASATADEQSMIEDLQHKPSDSGVPRAQEMHARMAALICMKLNSQQLAEIFERCGSIHRALFDMTGKALEVRGVSNEKLKAVRNALKSGAVERELEACAKSRTSILMIEDELYPPALRAIHDPPLLLWQRGKLEVYDHFAFAIVGSRSASYYGTKQSARFAGLMAARGVTVISGLARGVDTAAHRGALDAGGRTVAVVGSGFDKLYPPENVNLAKEIAENGALLSEYPLRTPGRAQNFPVRNRIISGLSTGVLVIQAGLKSGSLITARLANEQGREVFALPGKIDDEASRGGHALIKDGAKLVEGLEDIIAELPSIGMLPEETLVKGKQEKAQESLNFQMLDGSDNKEARILRLLKPSDEVNVEEIIRDSGIPAGDVNATLLGLEMSGLIRQLPGRNYVLS